MSKTTRILSVIAVCTTLISLFSCSKSSSGINDLIAKPYALSYGDSILYLHNGSSDYIVQPLQQNAGTYSAFPQGLDIDAQSGAINVSRSETGLRYRITHVSASGETTNTIVLLSGVNYTDNFYRLSAGDSIAAPVYNGSLSGQLPGGSDFDYGNSANYSGCAMEANNGRINLNQTIRNGAFGAVPVNGSSRDFDVVYRVNDGSGKAMNQIKLRVFYYQHESDVDADLLAELRERQTEGVFIGAPASNIHFAASASNPVSFTGGITEHGKNRPPCVVIIAN